MSISSLKCSFLDHLNYLKIEEKTKKAHFIQKIRVHKKVKLECYTNVANLIMFLHIPYVMVSHITLKVSGP